MKRILFICLFVFGLSAFLAAQEKQPCRLTKNLGGKYKFVGGETSIVEGNQIFFLRIKLPPEKINKDYLLQVAQRIKETYCHDDRIQAQIWDSSAIKKYDDLTPPPIFPPWTKAIYDLDKTENKEGIQFVSNDKVTGEIIISQ